MVHAYETIVDKTCAKCGKEKSLDEFHRRASSKDGRQHWCKKCAASVSAARIADDPERRKTDNANWYRANREKMKEINRRKSLMVRYGITPEEFDIMLSSQEGCCAICGSDKPGGKGNFHVDHCHETGRVRGLLCHNCNTGIGKLGDNPDRVITAAMYLLAHLSTYEVPQS